MELAKKLLNEQGYTCVLHQDGHILTATERGVKPLVRWLSENAQVQGYCAADKVVGKATAYLYVLLGVRAVHAQVMSRSAADVLERHGIRAEQDTLVEKPVVSQIQLLGDVYLELLGPLQKSYTDINNSSLVIMASYGKNRFLFTGDMRHEAEKELMDAGTDLKADVLKVGHHGSYTSTSYLFLRTVQPDYAVIQCGRDNEYGHPHSEPMSRLRDADVDIYRNDLLGTVIACSDGTNITFSWEFENAKPEINYPSGDRL